MSCRSFRSNYRPGSQSRKISIGVPVDPSAKSRPKNTGEQVVVVPVAERLVPSKVNASENRQKAGIASPSLGRKIDAPDQETSPWISTRSFKGVTFSEAAHHARQNSSISSTSKMLNRHSGRKQQAATHSVQFLSNQTSSLEPTNVNQKNSVVVANQNQEGKDTMMNGMEEGSHAAAKDVVPKNESTEKAASGTGNNGHETLRMKIWEILGAVSSPVKQRSNLQSIDMGANNLNPMHASNGKTGSLGQLGQHSDTIETDSENPDKIIRRSVKRSLTRKKRRTEVSLKKTKKPSACQSDQAHKLSNILSDIRRSHHASEIIKPRDGIQGKDHVPAIEVTNQQKDIDVLEENVDPKEDISNLLSKNDCEIVKPRDGIQGKDHVPHVPATEVTNQQEDINGLEKNLDRQEDISLHSFNVREPPFKLQSPTFKLNTPNKGSSPGSSLKTDDGVPDVNPAEGVLNTEGIHRFKSPLASNRSHNIASANAKTFLFIEELEDSFLAMPSMTRNNDRNGLRRLSSGKRGFEGSGDDSPMIGCNETELLDKIGTAEKPDFVPRPLKRYQVQGSVEDSGLSSSSESVKVWTGNEDGDSGLQEAAEHHTEDWLVSAITLFASALERIKGKMGSMTRRRAADILSSVSEKIHFQLHNAESQIQTDIGKLKGPGTTNRRYLETQFQEQQEQLKFICKRFQEEVNRHLQDCKRALEGLESNQTEYKGAIEKQKVLHRELLLQAEEAIGKELNDAERRITGVHKMARAKMLQLKYAIAGCLKDSILS